jgi:hypothetical protein
MTKKSPKMEGLDKIIYDVAGGNISENKLKSAVEIAMEKTGGIIPKKEEEIPGRNLMAAQLAMRNSERYIKDNESKVVNAGEKPPVGESKKEELTEKHPEEDLEGNKELSEEKESTIKMSENFDPERNAEFVKLKTAEDELEVLKRDLEDLKSIDPGDMMFKGLSSEKQRERMLDSMLSKAQKKYAKKEKEVKKMREKLNAFKELGDKNIKLKEYREGLEKAEMSAKPMETSYYEDLVDTTSTDIKRLKRKSRGGVLEELIFCLPRKINRLINKKQPVFFDIGCFL